MESPERPSGLPLKALAPCSLSFEQTHVNWLAGSSVLSCRRQLEHPRTTLVRRLFRGTQNRARGQMQVIAFKRIWGRRGGTNARREVQLFIRFMREPSRITSFMTSFTVCWVLCVRNNAIGGLVVWLLRGAIFLNEYGGAWLVQTHCFGKSSLGLKKI